MKYKKALISIIKQFRYINWDDMATAEKNVLRKAAVTLDWCIIDDVTGAIDFDQSKSYTNSMPKYL